MRTQKDAKAKTPTPTHSASASGGGADKRALRGMSYEEGAAALRPGDDDAGADPFANAKLDLMRWYGAKGFRESKDIVDVDDVAAFKASLCERFPMSTPLHELPYAVELRIFCWETPDHHSFDWLEKGADEKYMRSTRGGGLFTEYQEDPFTIADLDG